MWGELRKVGGVGDGKRREGGKVRGGGGGRELPLFTCSLSLCVKVQLGSRKKRDGTARAAREG